MPTKFGIVIPAYNAAEYIQGCLESVRRQTLDDFVCVVVDDGSLDETGPLVLEIAALDDRFSLISSPTNLGQSSAKNLGAAAVAGRVDWLWFLDSDDELKPRCLERVLYWAELFPSAVAVGVQYDALREDGSLLARRRTRYVPGFPLPRDLRDDEIYTPAVTFYCATGQGPFYALKAENFDTGYDETLAAHEDADLLLRYSLMGDVLMFPEALYVKRERELSMTVVGQARGSGELFEAKWAVQSFTSSDVRLWRAACHYHFVHVPLRDLKVARRAFRERNWHRAGMLVVHALSGTIGMQFALAWRRSRVPKGSAT